LTFDRFRLRCDGGGLLCQDASGAWAPISVGSRALEVLGVLVRHHGDLVTKDDIMRAVWRETTVEEHNLTVQIAALRRVLDAGRANGSCIQTVVSRGYRFLHAVTVQSPDVLVPALAVVSSETHKARPSDRPLAQKSSNSERRPGRRTELFAALVAVLIVAGVSFGALLASGWWGGSRTSRISAPRLSIVVLPFQNLSGDTNEDYLVDGVTDDLTTDLSHVPEAFVIANATARTYKGKAVDVRQIGQELGVRYVVEGSARLLGTAMRVNVQLISTETGAHLWSDRFDESITDLAAGEDAILARMRGTLSVTLIELEVARGRRVPPTAPDAFDLVLRARALRNQPSNRQRFDEALSLYEQALRLDPSSVLALTGAAFMLLENNRGSANGWSTVAEQKGRVETLVTRAMQIAPASEEALGVYAYWLFVQTPCQQSMAAARYMIETFPNPTIGYGILSECLIVTGHSEEAIPLMEKVIRLNPRDTFIAFRYSTIGSAHLFLGHYEEAIKWLERAVAANPERHDNNPGGAKRKLAAAYAHAGKDTEARRALVAADNDWPFDTVRGHSPDDINEVFSAQVRAYQEGLRRAGERDHAEEDADFGVSVDAVLHSDLAGYTPVSTPSTPTIRTAELPKFIADRKPIIIDPRLHFWGHSIPGAVGLKNAGIGGTVTDDIQVRLGRKMTELTGGDLNRPIVAVAWNSERFDGRNLALRLVALGYTNVLWYRGGREAWEVAGLPEAELVPQNW
jgi:adenylate cyclase